YFDPEGGDIRALRLQLGWDEENVWEVEGTRTPLFDVSSWASICHHSSLPMTEARVILHP
ncbi:MAG: hypothetical protein R6X27_15550, partial [Candidatus Desulfacyla sp.]